VFPSQNLKNALWGAQLISLSVHCHGTTHQQHKATIPQWLVQSQGTWHVAQALLSQSAHRMRTQQLLAS
jgi:hypothetical protein